MKNKLMNFVILWDVLVIIYLIITYLLSALFPVSDGPGFAGIFAMGAPWILIIILFVTLFSLRNKSLNKDSNLFVSLVSIILFVSSLYFIIFGIGADIGSLPLSRVTKSNVICGLILDGSTRERCMVDISMLKGDSSSCFSLTSDDRKNQCFWRVAEKTLDVGLCKSSGRRYEDVCVINVAKGTGNKEYCDLLPVGSTFSKEYCISSVK